MPLPLLALAAGAASGGLKALGSAVDGIEANKAATANAGSVMQQAEDEVESIMLGGRKRRGQNIAKAGSNGVGFGGSTLDIMIENARLDAFEASNTRNTAKNRAIEIRRQGRAAKRKGLFGAGSALLGAAANIAGGGVGG